jgi:hypothetical protein
MEQHSKDSIISLDILENEIFNYYIRKGYIIGVGCWGFEVVITSKYKNKDLLIKFYEVDCSGQWHMTVPFSIETIETLEELFKETFDFFTLDINEAEEVF